MPHISSSNYKPLWYYPGGNSETILPSLFRKVELPPYQRERITTPDNDFLDLDWLKQDFDRLSLTYDKRLVIRSHGLEGNSSRHYIKGMAKIFYQNGFNVVAWNCRSCSGEINFQPRLYNHAMYDDLQTIIQHTEKSYDAISLIGFSLGGSLGLNYLGQEKPSSKITSSINFSVPCDLGASARLLDASPNNFYRNRFLKKLKKKIIQKAEQFPSLLDLKGIEKINSFYLFDSRFTTVLHGFSTAEAFYKKGSANNSIEGITVPTLLVNAKNDPMVPESCYPYAITKNHSFVHFETPARGGHVGFPSNTEFNWIEERALEFVLNI